MAAYRRVYDLQSPVADCLYTGISCGPTLGNEYGRTLPFLDVTQPAA